MSNDQITIALTKRDTVRKGLPSLRQAGKIPAVIHNHGQESVVVEGNYIDVLKVYKRAGKHHAVDVTVDGKKFLTIIKDVDFEPKKNTLRHVVFGAIRQDEKVETEVPLVFEGDAPAEKAGLMVIRQLDHVQVEALPRDLPDELTVSIEGLAEIGDKVSVADITAPDGVTILTELEHGIAVVEETKAQMSEEAEEEAVEGEETPEDGKETATDDESADEDASDKKG